jgi:glycosyltransferase involved in cell wall biosynthesis
MKTANADGPSQTVHHVKTDPKVSILIPCYNAKPSIGQAIRSALRQTWPNKEVIVVDYGSTDGSLDIIRSFESAIRSESGPHNESCPERNRLLALADGEWIQLLDSHDDLLDDKIASQLISMVDPAAVDVIYSQSICEYGRNGYATPALQSVDEMDDPCVLLARWLVPGTSAVLYRRSAIQSVGGWNLEQRFWQEEDLFLRLLMAGKRFDYTPRLGAICRGANSGTVCSEDPKERTIERLKMVDRLSAHLIESQQLTPARQIAIAHGRLACARGLYRFDREAASSAARRALDDCHGLPPTRALDAFPFLYQWACRLLGFDATERLSHALGGRSRSLSRALDFGETSHHIEEDDVPAGANQGTLPIADIRGSSRSTSKPATSPASSSASSTSTAKISILIPCFNAEHWIAQAIRSALAQTWENKEVIVVDDGSTDRSLEIIQSFGDAIRIETGPNRGGNVARNRLLQLSEGEWVQFLDADDYLLPRKIERQLSEVPSGPAVDVLYSPTIFEYWEMSRFLREESEPMLDQHDPWIELVRWMLPQTGGMLFRRSALVDVGGWKPSQRCCQECELYFRLLAAEKSFQFCPSPGAVYRFWSTQTVCNRDPLLTLKTRLAIVHDAEGHLQKNGALSDERRAAIAFTRIECARSLYRLDRQEAMSVAAMTEHSFPRFKLPPASCFPRSYRWAHQLAGFWIAEKTADLIRPLRRRRLT